MKKNNFLFFVGMLSIGLCANTPIFAQSKTTTFEQLTTAIKNISYASIDVADYDNDGDDDFVIEGAIDSNDDGYADKSILYVYKNNDGTYEEIGDANLYGLHLGSVKFIDIDNDGDYDIIASGQNYSDISVHYLSIYENNNGSFTKKQDLVGGIYTSTDCGDIDNDGDMDFIISGTGMVSGSLTKFFKIYENNNAVFTEITNTIVPNRAGCAKFGDIDTDGDLDIILMGLTDDSTSPKTMRTYKNANGTFSESQILSVGLCNGWFDLGDIDDDGDLDIVAMGLDNDINGKIIVYKNENSNFTADASINGISSSSSTNSLEFGDYDNDGDLDFISAGSDASYNSNTTLYKNTNGVFSSSEETFVQVGGGATLAWLDIDKDNDLDLFLSGFSTVSGSYATSTFMYKNNITATNAKPEKPTNLQYSATETKSTFSWDASTDDHTNSLALSYLLTVGTTEGKGDIMSYVVHGTSWSLKKIETEPIYWSVQAIDASNVRSDKATASTVSYTFEQLTTAINNISYASIDVADYDNDGDDDFVIGGAIDSNDDGYADKSILYVYKNNDGTYEEIGDANLYGLHLGSVKFIDIDNDGDYDIIASGQNYSDITKHLMYVYENTNGTFSEKQSLQGYIYSSIDCGDIDNDGDMDFIITGIGITGETPQKAFKIYENDNAVFTEKVNTITPVQNACTKLKDFDNDGDLDLILMGLAGESNTSTMKTYKNEAGIFVENQIFSEGIGNGWIDMADYDNDGDQDFAIMGQDNDGNAKAYIYKYDVNTFKKVDDLYGVSTSSSTNTIEWGDYDNDGDFDLVMAGGDDDYNDTTLLYKNTDGAFSIVNEGLAQVGGSATLAWLDIDKDNDLDILVSGFRMVGSNYVTSTILHKNNITATNAKPEKPTNLQYSATETKSTFSWDASTDDHTNSLALSYLLTVGTTEGKGDIMSYVVHGTSWSLKKIETETIYWSVQAIDASNVRSDKATDAVLEIKEIDGNDKLFSIKPNPCVNYIKINNNTTIENIELIDMQGKIVKQVKTTELNTVKIDVSDLNSGIYIAKITSGNNVVTRKFIKR